MKQLKNIMIFTILLMTLFSTICFAQSEMRIVSDKETIKQGEEVSVGIEISNTQIAAGTLEIYFDFEKLEYIKGPENSNFSNHRILYTWVSSSGQDEQTLEIGEFVFKALQDGIANIVVIGEFYNANGEKIEIDNSNLQLLIGEQEGDTNQIISMEQQENVAKDNTDLSILRLNHEEISPDFKKDIKEYYFIADDTIKSLEVTAIPENQNATVTITGNQNFKTGKNTIDIRVVSEDKTKEEVYQIFVTKTTNIEAANANLENLAVRQGTLNPEFDPNMTRYQVEIANDIENIDILAIPQSQKAVVTIIGNDGMKVGDNTIQINVLAEDGITNKKYEMIVHRRNEEEELQHNQEEQIQIERLSAILEENEKEKEEENNNMEEISKEQKGNALWIIIVLALGIIIIGAILYKNKNKLKKYMK